MAYLLILIGSFLLGLALLVTGAILLFKVKKKIAGIVVGAIGLVFTLLPLALILFQIPVRAVKG